LNFNTEEVTKMVDFKSNLGVQPEYFCMSKDQKYCIASTLNDSLWIDIELSKEVDLDELYDIKAVKQIIHDPEDEKFYILCN
jgi:hypothetical protein